MIKKRNKIITLALMVIFLFVSTLYLLDSRFNFNWIERASELFSVNTPITQGRKFAFVSNSVRDLTQEEMQYLATNYDLLVLGNQTKPMDMEARIIKEINPNIKMLVYFPTTIRHKAAIYGTEDFNPDWYLKDIYGQLIYKGSGQNIAYIDITNTDYQYWARRNVNNFMRLAPYDGFLFDNANPITISRVGAEKITAYNLALTQYLRNMTATQNKRSKLVVFNGIHRLPSKTDRSIANVDITNGAINEMFCYGQNSAGVVEIVPKEMQLEDINLQLEIANRQKYVLQKVNMPQSMWGRYGKYCYGIFLMADVQGFTYFKFGEGYNLNVVPNEYKTNLPEFELNIGKALSNYIRDGWLFSREFENYYVVVNMNEFDSLWNIPINNKTVNIPAKDAVFIDKTKIDLSTPSPITTCKNFCIQSQNRPNGGWCAYASINCSLNGATHYPDGNKYCAPDRNYCCCR